MWFMIVSAVHSAVDGRIDVTDGKTLGILGMITGWFILRSIIRKINSAPEGE